MRLKLILARPDGTAADIVVTADAGATLGEVATRLAEVDPAAGAGQAKGDVTLGLLGPRSQDLTVLPSDATLTHARLASGTVVGIVSSAQGQDRASAGGPALARIRFQDGPQAGPPVELPAGSYLVGRAPDCDFVLHDPLVSKRHLRVDVGDRVEVVDLGSANGIVVDGGLVTRLSVTGEQEILVGDTPVWVTAVPRPDAPAQERREPVELIRSPRVEARYPGGDFAVPDPPEETESQPLSLVAVLMPLLIGGVMFAISRNVTSIVFILFSPLMLLGNHLTERRRRRRRDARDLARFTDQATELRAALRAEQEREHELRNGEMVSADDTFRAALRYEPLLWTRRPEHWSFLALRLGSGRLRSRTRITAPPRGKVAQRYQDVIDEILRDFSHVEDVPVIESLADAGGIGVAGPRAATIGVVNSLLIQLTALHSPAEVLLAAAVSPSWSESLEWLKWLPHTSPPHSPLGRIHLANSEASAAELLSGLEDLLAERREQVSERRDRGPLPWEGTLESRAARVFEAQDAAGTQVLPVVIVVVTQEAPVPAARLVQLAEQGPDLGLHVLWVAPELGMLPAACRTHVLVEDGGTARVGFVRLGEVVERVRLEVADPAVATAYGRAMAVVTDLGMRMEDDSDLPRSISLVTLLGDELFASSEAVVDRWRQNQSIYDRAGAARRRRRPGSLRAVVGSAGADAMHLDLRGQGPHALVGGTTGSGKSEFLQSWVLAMSAEYSPDKVTFLFVDYKGGAAFAECTDLPHCVGLVTDLSPHLVRRALTSLRAELRFREHLFNRKKAKDLLEMERRGDAETPPALVIVIDEFAALVSDVPEFVDGVVDVAQRGRSLGIHLIMATQRPAGVIKDNLRANTNLRVALRVADEHDSSDILDVPDAAHFDPALPGRAIAKTGPGRLRPFQAAYAGGWTTAERQRPTIVVNELRFGGEVLWETQALEDEDLDQAVGPNDQKRLVAVIRKAFRSARLPAPRKPWLDSLDATYDLLKLPQSTDAELLIGVCDVPDRQEQRPVHFRPDADGHLGVYGASGSGKSTLMRSLAVAAGITPNGGPVLVYALDFAAGSLRMLEHLPHVGAVIRGDDTERVMRVLRMVRTELDRRSVDYAEVSAESIVGYRQLAGRPGEPRVLLVIDGFPAFRDDYDSVIGRSEYYDIVRDVLTDGRQLGMHVVLGADRVGAVPPSVRSGISRNVVLRLADDDYTHFGYPADILTADSPPGRAILDGDETQVAVVGGTPSVPEQARIIERLGRSMGQASVARAEAVGAMPREVAPESLPESVSGWPVLGIADTDLGPLGFAPSGRLLLSGPPGSGRSTAMAAIARALLRNEPATRCYLLAAPGSALLGAARWAGVAQSPQEAAEILAAALAEAAATSKVAVLVEQIGDYASPPVEALLLDLLRASRGPGVLCVAESETQGWTSGYGQVFTELKGGRRGIILQPDQGDGDTLLRTPLPRLRHGEFPVGRGVYIANGRVVRVQLPRVVL